MNDFIVNWLHCYQRPSRLRLSASAQISYFFSVSLSDFWQTIWFDRRQFYTLTRVGQKWVGHNILEILSRNEQGSPIFALWVLTPRMDVTPFALDGWQGGGEEIMFWCRQCFNKGPQLRTKLLKWSSFYTKVLIFLWRGSLLTTAGWGWLIRDTIESVMILIGTRPYQAL